MTNEEFYKELEQAAEEYLAALEEGQGKEATA